MRYLICPDSYKDCLPAAAVAEALARGVRAADSAATCDLVPLADGGEGTVAALVAANGGQMRCTTVTGPLGEPVDASWGLLDQGQAAIEMASASGLELVPAARRDARLTTTRGTGELLRAALDAGAERILLGIGGSATNDAGAGLAQALGVRLLDEHGADLPLGGAALARLARVDATGLDARLASIDLRVACDVDNPLCGPRGASAVYGPQKGADPAAVAELDAALAHWAEVVRRDLGLDVAQVPGAGAAGGLGAGLLAFCGARLVSGIDLVLDAVGFEERAEAADLVITGEGRLDGQTLNGKTVAGVAERARRIGVPVVAVGGAVALTPEQITAAGLLAAWPLPNRPMSLAEALAEAKPLLEQAGFAIARLYGRGPIS